MILNRATVRTAPRSVVVVDFPEPLPGASLSSSVPPVIAKMPPTQRPPIPKKLDKGQSLVTKKVPAPLIMAGPSTAARPSSSPCPPAQRSGTVWNASTPCWYQARCTKADCKFGHPNWRCQNQGCVNSCGHLCNFAQATCNLCNTRRPESVDAHNYAQSEQSVPSPARTHSAGPAWSPQRCSPPRSRSAQEAPALLSRSASESFTRQPPLDAAVLRSNSDVSRPHYAEKRPWKKSALCRFYSERGGCKKGESCDFVHSGRARPAATADGRFNSASNDRRMDFSRSDRTDN